MLQQQCISGFLLFKYVIKKVLTGLKKKTEDFISQLFVRLEEKNGGVVCGFRYYFFILQTSTNVTYATLSL